MHMKVLDRKVLSGFLNLFFLMDIERTGLFLLNGLGMLNYLCFGEGGTVPLSSVWCHWTSSHLLVKVVCSICC